MSTPLNVDVGVYQWRIRPTNWTPIDGEFVFCLGHDFPGQTYLVPLGVLLSLEQKIPTAGFNLLQFAIHLRAPTTTPSGYTWRCIVSTTGGDQRIIEFTNADTFQERTITDVSISSFSEPDIELSVALGLDGPGGPVEAELPAIYVDAAVSFNSPAPTVIGCKSPTPDEINVWPGRPIEFQAFALDGTGLTQTYVEVNGLHVATFGGTNASMPSFVAAGWTVDADLVSLADPVTTYTITPASPWDSEEIITVLVRVTTGSAQETDVLWTFTIIDTAGPRLLSAQAIGVYEIEAEWNEPISDASVDPSLFTITLASAVPAYVPNVMAVRRDSVRPSWIVLTIDQPATPGATYFLIASESVVDAVGNVVDPAYDSATFDAYISPLTPANRLLSLYQELPAAERDTDQFNELKLFCDVLDEALRALAVVADDWPLIAVDPDTAREDYLDGILWELGNPFDWLPLDVLKKRLLARWMHALVALKGSGLGIRAAIRLLLGIEVQVHVYGFGGAGLGEAIMGETFILGSDDEDDIYTFWVIVPEQLDAETREYMNRIIDIMKVAHERHQIIEPQTAFVPDHWQMGFSRLNLETVLHAS